MARKIAKKLQTIANNVHKVYRAGALQGVQTQEKTVKPSTESQEVLPDNGYLLSKVTVEVPDKPFINTAGITDFSGFFYNGSRLDQFDKVDFSQGNHWTATFREASNLTETPQIDMPSKSGMMMMNMFYGCKNLKTAKQPYFANVGMMQGAFQNCTALEEFDVDMSSNTCYNYNSTFSGCTNLKTVKTLNLSNAISIPSMFSNCTNLTNITLLNIKINLTIGSGSTWGHLLTVDSLINTIKELVDVGAARTLTMGSVNKAKIANIYCVITDDTTPKMSIEIVDAGTEGAMTLENFARLKGWSIT